MEKIKYLVSGDCTVCVEFGNEISPEINRRIRAFKIALEKEAIDGVVETIPTYRSLSVVYRPEVIRFGELTKKFDAVLETMDSIQIPPPSVIEIPVLYGGDMGPDLEFVAAHNHKTPEEVVRIHKMCIRDRAKSGHCRRHGHEAPVHRPGRAHGHAGPQRPQGGHKNGP